jgi:CheY-like chemotaxis protein
MRDRFATITRAAETAGDLTDNILALGRKQAANPRPVNINLLVREMQPMVHAVLSRGTALDIQTFAQRPFVLADRPQLERALLNIFLKLRDVVGDSGAVLVQTDNVKAPNGELGVTDFLSITITDTGPGIPAEFMPKIFELFSGAGRDAITGKALSGSGKVPSGKGLGLGSAHGVFSESGGRIGVESTAGSGSRITIQLPVWENPTGTGSIRALVGVAGEVLLIQGDASIHQADRDILSAAGFGCRHAANGQEALKLLLATPGEIQVAITDIGMPEFDGVEFARLALEMRPDLRILFVSRHAGDRGLISQFRVEAVAFLQRPFTPRALTEKVAELLKR